MNNNIDINLNTKLIIVFNNSSFKPYDLDERNYNLIKRLLYYDFYFNEDSTFEDLLQQVESKKISKNKQIGIKTLSDLKTWINKNFE